MASRIGLAVLKWHPHCVLVAYMVLISGYLRYLDGSLRYMRPQIPAAPEDVLGFGFWFPWLMVAVWFAIACALSYRFGSQRKRGYWLPLLCAFGLLSIADFGLYSVLEGQLLAG